MSFSAISKSDPVNNQQEIEILPIDALPEGTTERKMMEIIDQRPVPTQEEREATLDRRERRDFRCLYAVANVIGYGVSGFCYYLATSQGDNTAGRNAAYAAGSIAACATSLFAACCARKLCKQ